MKLTINADGLDYRTLNDQIRKCLAEGNKELRLTGINGQRYLAGGLDDKDARISVEGVAGEDLAAFMAGPSIDVHANAQNGIANTMNDGCVIIHGRGGDVAGYGMRGGRVFIRDSAGYRTGIHMKGFGQKQPAIIIGQHAEDFCGEYQAGGCLVILGLGTQQRNSIVGDYCGTGMHGGVMYIRGPVRKNYLGREVNKFDLEESDIQTLHPLLDEFVSHFTVDENIHDFHRYCKIIPVSTRPYGQLYTY